MKTLHFFAYKISLVIFCALLIASCSNNSSGSSGGSGVNGDSTKTDTVPHNAQANALPFSLEFVQQAYNGQAPFPRIQAYVSLFVEDQYLLIIGGRRQGLHTFQGPPTNNFIPDSSNNYIFVLDLRTGTSSSFNVDSLSPDLSAPLQSANQEIYYDRPTDQVYIIGGYGWNAAKTNMLTFNTIINFKAKPLIAAIRNRQPPAKIASLLNFASDKLGRFAVTGGELFMRDSKFYLVFGQNFTGQYRAFGGSDFTQKYTEETRVFTLKPNTLEILSYGSIPGSNNADHPLHRRDGNTVEDIDPATGASRIAAFGGVFQPGAIAPYTYPIYIKSPSGYDIDTTGNQKFSQYECPVISIFDSASANPTMYHTFFGGIGHYYYFQTPSQKAAFDTVTKEGRNDGFPFVADVTTFLHSKDGSYNEFIHTNPIPGNRLVGATAKFWVNESFILKGVTYPNGVIKLPMFSNNRKTLIGYIYGGIEAQNPLPLAPNTGTFVSNSVFAVYLTRSPTAAIPAGFGHASSKDYQVIRK
ncbi:MAG: hypothetical protein JST09_19840 [Bacteroidetes bacterium]|nr:hypothetical protein [Bacteroidota bacterium]